ncbi:MAG: tRNA glutamyl-Q(34) synthetase GluQRS [Marinobacter sp.]|uniref:tRNA glutamyl-Q(34) synthetase GluQRS n=1 Tax=Marinobacter sp. TaxID=50741 RepID=UPI0034A07B6D
MPAKSYRGRFAPSPTGPLHFGSLVTALASYLEAKCRNGQWLVRIENLDPLRESTPAVHQILKSLQAHGLIADEKVRFQSDRHQAYFQAIDALRLSGKAYYCACSRKLLKAHGGHHPDQCRQQTQPPAEATPRALRFALEDAEVRWHDEFLGPQQQVVKAEIDDPVILRKEGFFAYQLAVVVDDIDQGITDVVRGSDLLEMTAQQLQVFAALKTPAPRWLHIPVILNHDGQKLSKQNHAPALDDQTPGINLWQALRMLGQRPPQELQHMGPEQILGWACTHWQRELIPRHSVAV